MAGETLRRWLVELDRLESKWWHIERQLQALVITTDDELTSDQVNQISELVVRAGQIKMKMANIRYLISVLSDDCVDVLRN
ncbi:MAG: hypothetical protein HY332_06590 [Chloroflexi bacterium]|nr:hypothetical protein [Chloroflexota bacterium]